MFAFWRKQIGTAEKHHIHLPKERCRHALLTIFQECLAVYLCESKEWYCQHYEIYVLGKLWIAQSLILVETTVKTSHLLDGFSVAESNCVWKWLCMIPNLPKLGLSYYDCTVVQIAATWPRTWGKVSNACSCWNGIDHRWVCVLQHWYVFALITDMCMF